MSIREWLDAFNTTGSEEQQNPEPDAQVLQLLETAQQTDLRYENRCMINQTIFIRSCLKQTSR